LKKIREFLNLPEKNRKKLVGSNAVSNTKMPYMHAIYVNAKMSEM
jgi:hypothetical protein